MRFGRTLASTLVAASVVATPIAAQAAAPASRVDSRVAGENLRGGFIIPLLALIAIILGILVLVNDDDEDLPHSP